MFKVGDWVRNTWLGTIKKYSCMDKACDEKYDGTENESKHWEHWKPQEGEWVIPSKAKADDWSTFKVTKYSDTLGECEPFIGELPSFVKAKL